jgi:hypothetical protein
MNVQGSSLCKSKGSKDFELFVGRGIADGGLKPNEMSVLVHIASWSGGDRYCNSTLGQITETCRISRNSVTPIINKLESLGLISVKRRVGRDGRNRYKYNPTVVPLGVSPTETVVSQETNGSPSTDNGSISTDSRQSLNGDTPLPKPLPNPITKPTIDGLVDKFGVGGGKEQSEEEQVIQLLRAKDISREGAAKLACRPGCTRKLVQRAIDDMPREARSPAGLLKTKIEARLESKKAKMQLAKRPIKRPQSQRDDWESPTDEERADCLAQIAEFRNNLKKRRESMSELNNTTP